MWEDSKGDLEVYQVRGADTLEWWGYGGIERGWIKDNLGGTVIRTWYSLNFYKGKGGIKDDLGFWLG